MNEKWFGARITGPLGGTFSAAMPRARKNDQRVERREHAHELVDPVGLARARALVEPVEVLLRARVLVDLLLHRDQPRSAHALAYPGRARWLPLAQPRGALRRARRQPSSSVGALVVAHPRLVARALAPAAPDARPSVHRPAPDAGQVARRRARSSRRTSGTTTGTPSTSAWNCISQRVRASRRRRPRSSRQRRARRPPPSRAPRRPSGRRSPRAWRGRGARAPLPRVRPTIVPRAYGVPVRRAQAGQRRARSRRRRWTSSDAASASVSRGLAR